MQGLGTAEDGGEGLEGGPGDVVVRLLRREGDARGLGVEAHAQGAFVFGPVLLPEHGGPDAPRGAELADLLEKVYVRVEEEGEARREVVHVQPRLYAGFHVGEAVGEREGELLRSGAAGLADVVAAYAHRVPLRHVLGRVDEHVPEDAHGGVGREEPLPLGYVRSEERVSR